MANQVWNRLGQITSNYKNSLQASSLNNNQYSSYYSKLYPWLNEESYNKMVNAVDSLGLTWENRANAMNNYYRTHVKTLINDQTLQERDDIINQQAYEAAKLNNKDADAELRMTEAVQKAKKLWNLDATADDREVFSTMVETLWADGTKLAWEYLSWENDEFLYKTGLKDTTAQEQSKKYNLKRASIQNALVNNWQSLSDDGLKYLRNYNAIFDTVNEARDRGMWEGMSDSELLKELMNYSPELKDLGTEIDRLESKLDFGDKTILWMVDDVYAKDRHEGINMIRDFLWWNSNTPATTADIEQALYTRGAFDDNYVWELGNQLKVYADQPINSIKKKLYRTTKEMENLNSTMDSFWTKIMPKWVAETILGGKMSDEEYKQYIQDRVNENNANIERNKEKVLGYQQKINNAFAEKVAKNLDPEIKDYYDNKSITELMTEWDRNWVGYKQAQSVASNRDMLPNMVITAINAPAWMTLMFGDSYARESQEAFENMLEHWATYEQAQVGGEVVWTVNAIVEVWLDRLLGWVETRTSKNLKNAFMGNLKEEIGKKWFGEILLNAIKEYGSASGEEWLEEVIQQIVGNAAVKTIDNRQDILEWVGEAFEGWALNPMNLMAWGSEILQNKDNIRNSMLEWAYNAGKFSRNVYDTFNSKSIVDNIQNSMLNWAERAGEKAWSIYYWTKNLFNKWNQNVTTENVESKNIGTENIGTESTAITPQWTETTVNETVTDMDNWTIALMDEETSAENNTTTDLAETQWGSKFWEAVSWLEDNIKEKIKRNPYAIDESRELIKNMENNPWLDFTEYQNERYESVLDMIEERLKQAEDKRRNDVWGLYTKLEEANAPIDTTNLKNRVAEYQARVEELWDILSSSDKAKIETILKNIQEIGDWTMDIWKVRKIADQWAKYDQWATWDWIRLIRDIRNAIDDEIMAQNPEMKEVDQAYKKAKDEIQDLRGNLTYKKTWEIKSNAVSTVKNMLNANNKKYLSTLEKYIPWITERLQAIRDSKLVYNAYTSWEGSRFVSKWRDFVTKWILAWGGYLLWWPVGAGIWYLISWKVDAAITSLARKWLKETITKETPESRAELERINKKIEENQRLEAEEKAKLRELWDRIMQNVATMDKTDTEQSAWNSWLADLEQDEVIDMPEEVYDQWEEVTTTPKKKTTKKKTSKKQTENNVKLDTKKIASDYMKWDMDWNKYQHLAWLTEEQALEKRWKFETAIDEEWDKNQDYYNTHQSELVEKFHHLLK